MGIGIRFNVLINMNKESSIDVYLSGKLLFGDDFSEDQIIEWYNDEKEAYADLVSNNEYSYSYHRINKIHAYRYLKNKKFENVLGYGSAFGHEFIPIIKQIKYLTIIDPSDAFKTSKLFEVPLTYKKPTLLGDIEFPNSNFDLIVCLGTLHHIPNVSKIIQEFYRVAKPNSTIILREPIISMGDWRQSRKGLTKRERGIPKEIFQQIIIDTGFKIINKKYCFSPLTTRLGFLFKNSIYNSPFFVFFDQIISFMFSFNIKYHRTKLIEKLSPISVFYLLKK